MKLVPSTQHSLPIWVGGQGVRPRKRSTDFAGYMPLATPGRFTELIPLVKKTLEEKGRDGNSFGTMGRIPLADGTPLENLLMLLEWIELGVTHIALTSTGALDPLTGEKDIEVNSETHSPRRHQNSHPQMASLRNFPE